MTTIRDIVSPSAVCSSDACELRNDLNTLLVFRHVLEDDAGRSFVALVDALADDQMPAARRAYGRLFALLSAALELGEDAAVGDAWQSHLLERVVIDENVFSRKASRGRFDVLGPSLVAATRHDLRVLQRAAMFTGSSLAEALGQPLLPAWDEFHPLVANAGDGRGDGASDDRTILKRRLLEAADWSAETGVLHSYFSRHSPGPLGRYHAFRWRHRADRGELVPIVAPDPITLDELIGYAIPRATVVRNTDQFLAGQPANNVLLYGDRGTGKSSTVKALLNRYARDGLRLVEVNKQELASFAELIGHLRDRPERFIIFVDDLSFDEHETTYRDVKAVLEGGVEVRPPNVLLYATSNRRHLIQERFSDRAMFPTDDEKHTEDTQQEKLSLADRFGIAVTFVSPDQEQYLQIVRGLARRRGLTISEGELTARALQWAVRNNGRSGRGARQFIDQLTGEQALQRRG